MSFRSGGKGLRPSDDGQFQDSAGQSAETMLLSRKVGLDELWGPFPTWYSMTEKDSLFSFYKKHYCSLSSHHLTGLYRSRTEQQFTTYIQSMYYYSKASLRIWEKKKQK